MPTESTIIIIGAKDNASPVLAKVGDSANRLEKKTVDLSKGIDQAGVATSEWLGKLLGPEVSMFAGELGRARDVLGEFANGQALTIKNFGLMQAGLAGLVGYFSYRLGDAISGSAAAARQLNDELTRTQILLAEKAELDARNEAFEKFQMSLIRDADNQRDALEAMIDQKLKLQSDAERQLQRAKDELNTALGEQIISRDRFNVLGRDGLGLLGDTQDVQDAEQRLKEVQTAAKSARDQVAEYREELKRLGARETSDQKQEVVKSLADGWKKARESVTKYFEQVQKQAKTDKDFLDGLRAQVIELKNGKEAADAYRLSLRTDISEQAKQQAAAIQAEIAALKEKEQAEKRGLEARKQIEKEIEKLKTERDKGLSGGSGGNDNAGSTSRFLAGRTSAGLSEAAKQTVELKRSVQIQNKIEKLQRDAAIALKDIAENTREPDEVLS
jgi:DNA repair exonuclease SbcCD ATPase subunit